MSSLATSLVGRGETRQRRAAVGHFPGQHLPSRKSPRLPALVLDGLFSVHENLGQYLSQIICGFDLARVTRSPKLRN